MTTFTGENEMFKEGDLFDTPNGVMAFDHIDADGDFWFKGSNHDVCFDPHEVTPHKVEPTLRDHPHAEVMYRWLTELDSVVQFSVLENVWNDTPNPSWDHDTKYRIKPNTVTKYQWVIFHNWLEITTGFYKDENDLFDTIIKEDVKWVQRLDQTATEFEVTSP